MLTSLTRNLSILAVGEIAARGLTFFAFAHLARTVDRAAFGLVESALAVMMFATLIVDQGLGTLGARDVARDRSVAQSVAGRVVSARLVLALAVLAGLVLGAQVLPIDYTLAVLVTGLSVSLLGHPFQLNWVFQGRDEMLWFAAPPVLRQTVFLVCILFLVTAPEEVTLMPWAEVAGAAVMAVAYIAVFRARVGRLRFSLRGSLDRHLFADALPIGASQLIWALRMFLPVLFVGGLLGPEAVGLFAVGHRIVIVYHAGLEVYFTNLLPHMSQRSNDPAGLVRLYRRSLPPVLVPTLVLAFVSIWAAPNILNFVFGDAYVVDQSILSFLMLTWLVPVWACRRTVRLALIVRDQQRAELLCSVAGIVLLLVSIVPLTLQLGIVGTALAMMISELLGMWLAWTVLWRQLRNNISD